MKAFLDTSVLLAVFYWSHEHHARSLDLFLRDGRDETGCAAHSLAELYSLLTSRGGKDRVTGDEALLFLRDVRENLTVINLKPGEFFRALEQAGTLGIGGAAVHDAILAHCALKVDAETLYSWNPARYQRMGSEIAQRVKTP